MLSQVKKSKVLYIEITKRSNGQKRLGQKGQGTLPNSQNTKEKDVDFSKVSLEGTDSAHAYCFALISLKGV